MKPVEMGNQERWTHHSKEVEAQVEIETGRFLGQLEKMRGQVETLEERVRGTKVENRLSRD